jgi:hypothetical protein
MIHERMKCGNSMEALSNLGKHGKVITVYKEKEIGVLGWNGLQGA